MKIRNLFGALLLTAAAAVSAQGSEGSIATAIGNFQANVPAPNGAACATSPIIYDTTRTSTSGVEITSAANGPATCMGDKIVLGAGPRGLCDIQIEVFNLASSAPFNLTMELFTDCTTSGATGACGSGVGTLIPGTTRTIAVTPAAGSLGMIFPVRFDYSGASVASDPDSNITVKLNASRSDVFWRFNEVPTVGTIPAGEPPTSVVERCGSVGGNNGCARAFNPVGTNNNFGITIRGVTPPVAADLALTQSNNAAGNALLIGNTFQKTLTVTNNGPGAATAITVTDTLPSQLTFVSSNCGATAAGQVVTYTIPTLANGASNSCVLTVRINSSGTIINTAAITASTPADPTPANNTTTQQIGAPGGGIAQTAVPTLNWLGLGALLAALGGLALFAIGRRGHA